MLIESSEQLRSLTGNYYANNDFTKIQGDIEQATEELAALVGDGIIGLAEKAEEGDTLRLKVQRPIAILATLRLYQKNDLSHEDDGRKFKVSSDGSDKLPWEWQLDRDDALQMEAYFRAVDSLIVHLNKTRPEEWTATPLYRSTRPGDNSRTATEFSSPIGKTVVDQVELLRDAVIRTERGNSFYLVEFSLPLAELPPLANSSFYYDAGVIFSDASGSRNSFNLFHHSPLKGITADVPSEIRLTPSYMKKMTKFTKGNQQ